MVRLSLLSAAALASSAIAAPASLPVEKRGGASLDLVVLQFALTLEHLENVFYKEGLQKFSVDDFTAAGYSPDYYTDLEYISFDEQTHVVALEAAIKSLKAVPTKACKYSFPYTDVNSFLYLSHALEKTGVSAYLGAAALISSDYYLTVAGSILAVEAEHASLQRTVLGAIPIPNPFETPLTPTAVFTIAGQFIVSCPPHNFKLPFTPYPLLASNEPAATGEVADTSSPSVFIKRQTYTVVPPMAGDTVSFTASGKVPAGSYLTFANGIYVASVKADIQGSTVSAAIPSTILGGVTYVFVTSADLSGDFSTFDDTKVLFGGAFVEVKPAPPAINYHIL